MLSKVNRAISEYIQKSNQNPQYLLLGKLEKVELEKYTKELAELGLFRLGTDYKSGESFFGGLIVLFVDKESLFKVVS
jgi:hypothetical protein